MKVSGRKKSLEIVLGVIALLLFVAASLAWHYGRIRQQMCKPVLEKPIQFEDGFSLQGSFSVAYSQNYYVEVVCPRTNSPQSGWNDVVAALSKALPVKFAVTCNGVTVAEGDSPGEKNRTASAAEDTRIMTSFAGEAGKTYELSFHTVGAIPAVDATKPTVRITCLCWASSDLIDMLFSNTTPALVVAGVGLIFALWSWRIFTRKP